MPHVVADIFRQAAALNIQDRRRKGNVLDLEAGCRVIVAGDVHGNRTNLKKIIDYAALGANPRRRLVLQEVIHGPVDEDSSLDCSVELLLRVARLRIANPTQTALVLGNHDIAQAVGNEIAKDGRGVCKDFSDGVAHAFGPQAAAEISPAINEFLLSAPLAVRCPNGVFIVHSLPSPDRMELAGLGILDRLTGTGDLRRGCGAYEWTWGRGHTPEQIDDLAQRLGVQYFILGHQHGPQGCQTIGPKATILTSDNERGCVMEFSTDEPVTGETADGCVLRIISLGR